MGINMNHLERAITGGHTQKTGQSGRRSGRHTQHQGMRKAILSDLLRSSWLDQAAFEELH
jgi:hypothetical protein